MYCPGVNTFNALPAQTHFSRDMRQTGHWGTGDLELLLRTEADLERAKPLLERSYTEN